MGRSSFSSWIWSKEDCPLSPNHWAYFFSRSLPFMNSLWNWWGKKLPIHVTDTTPDTVVYPYNQKTSLHSWPRGCHCRGQSSAYSTSSSTFSSSPPCWRRGWRGPLRRRAPWRSGCGTPPPRWSCACKRERNNHCLLLLRIMVIILTILVPVSDAVADYESLATAHVLLAHCCELNLRGNSLEIDSQKSWDVFYVPLMVSGSRLFMIFNLKGVLSFPLSRASSQAIQLWCSENLWSGVLIHQISLMFHSVFL